MLRGDNWPQGQKERQDCPLQEATSSVWPGLEGKERDLHFLDKQLRRGLLPQTYTLRLVSPTSCSIYFTNEGLLIWNGKLLRSERLSEGEKLVPVLSHEKILFPQQQLQGARSGKGL